MSKIFVSGLKNDVGDIKLSESIKEVFLKSTDNLSWLKPGDKVLLKPALNSHFPYPATTHPLAVKTVTEILQNHGAQVIVGDQSGVEHVVHDSTGILKGSSKKCYEESGMSNSGIKFTAFEQRGWTDGYYHFSSPKTISWKDGFYLTSVVKEVDHIINLPRVSTHSQAGVTLGFKNMVGLLRLDSRLEFHADGPFNSVIRACAKKSNLAKFKNEDKFFEKIVEISLAIKDKLRTTIFVGTKAQITLGPDKYLLHLLKSKVANPSVGLVFGSADPIAAEMFAISYLTHLYRNVSLTSRILQKFLISLNGQAHELGTEKILDNPFIKHAVSCGLGEIKNEIIYLDELAKNNIN